MKKIFFHLRNSLRNSGGFFAGPWAAWALKWEDEILQILGIFLYRDTVSL